METDNNIMESESSVENEYRDSNNAKIELDDGTIVEAQTIKSTPKYM